MTAISISGQFISKYFCIMKTCFYRQSYKYRILGNKVSDEDFLIYIDISMCRYIDI